MFLGTRVLFTSFSVLWGGVCFGFRAVAFQGLGIEVPLLWVSGTLCLKSLGLVFDASGFGGFRTLGPEPRALKALWLDVVSRFTVSGFAGLRFEG